MLTGHRQQRVHHHVDTASLDLLPRAQHALAPESRLLGGSLGGRVVHMGRQLQPGQADLAQPPRGQQPHGRRLPCRVRAPPGPTM